MLECFRSRAATHVTPIKHIALAAASRNTWLVKRTDAVLVLYATPGSETERMAVELGKPLATLAHPAKRRLIDLGAYTTSATDPLLSTPEWWSPSGKAGSCVR